MRAHAVTLEVMLAVTQVAHTQRTCACTHANANADGTLNAIGSLSELLMRKDEYKSQLESLLVMHVFPEFQVSAIRPSAACHCITASLCFPIHTCKCVCACARAGARTRTRPGAHTRADVRQYV